MSDFVVVLLGISVLMGVLVVFAFVARPSEFRRNARLRPRRTRRSDDEPNDGGTSAPMAPTGTDKAPEVL